MGRVCGLTPAYRHDVIFPDTFYHICHVSAYQLLTVHDTNL